MSKKTNENACYFKSALAAVNVAACAIVSLIAVLTVYAIDRFNLLSALTATSKAAITVSAVALIAAAVLILIPTLCGLKKKGAGLTDSVLFTGALLVIAGAIYLICGGAKSYALKGGILLAVAAVIIAALFAVRAKNFREGAVSVKPENNATISSYYGSFFKKFGVYTLVLIVAMVLFLVFLDKANVMGSILKSKDLKPLFYTGLAILALLYAALYTIRLSKREQSTVDVIAFIGVIASVALFIVALKLNGNLKTAALVLSFVMLVVFAVSSVFLIKNAHIDTEDEEFEYAVKKGSVGFYFSQLIKNNKLAVSVALGAIAFALILIIDKSGIALKLYRTLEGRNTSAFEVAAIVAFVAVFAVMITELKRRTVDVIDSVLFAIFTACLLSLIVVNGVFGSKMDIRGAFVVIGLCVSLAFIVTRMFFVKNEIQEEVEAIGTEEETAREEAEAIIEDTSEETEPVEEEKPVEEKPVEETAEAEAESDTVTDNAESVAEETAASSAAVLPVDENEEDEEESEEPAAVQSVVKLKRVTVRKSFETYIRTGDDELKENYSAIENAFLKYGVHSRLTKSRENFSKKGKSMSKADPEKALRLQAKLYVRGKFLKLYLNVDPATIDLKYYRAKDVSEKFPDQPTFVKIRTGLSLRRAVELIDKLAENEGFKVKKRYEPVNFAEVYTDKSLSYMQKLGYDYIVKDSVTYEEVRHLNDEFAAKVLKTETAEIPERYIYDEVTLKMLSDNFDDGATVTMEDMRVKGLVKINANHITVKVSDSLSKKLIVEATAFEPKAVEMIAIAGGEATEVKFGE